MDDVWRLDLATRNWEAVSEDDTVSEFAGATAYDGLTSVTVCGAEYMVKHGAAACFVRCICCVSPVLTKHGMMPGGVRSAFVAGVTFDSDGPDAAEALYQVSSRRAWPRLHSEARRDMEFSCAAGDSRSAHPIHGRHLRFTVLRIIVPVEVGQLETSHCLRRWVLTEGFESRELVLSGGTPEARAMHSFLAGYHNPSGWLPFTFVVQRAELTRARCVVFQALRVRPHVARALRWAR